MIKNIAPTKGKIGTYALVNRLTAGYTDPFGDTGHWEFDLLESSECFGDNHSGSGNNVIQGSVDDLKCHIHSCIGRGVKEEDFAADEELDLEVWQLVGTVKSKIGLIAQTEIKLMNEG